MVRPSGQRTSISRSSFPSPRPTTTAPLDWDFGRYNTHDETATRAFLAESGAKPIIVPHRPNRAVIFDSDLFHETDRILFRDGYQNRRINITMLFGRRTFHGA